MKALGRFTLLLNLGLAIVPAHGQIFIGATEVDTTTVIQDLNVPWEVIYGPDDMLWVTERRGTVSHIHPTTGAKQTLLDLSTTGTNVVFQSNEAGMLGMALHPDFPTTSKAYVVYNYQSGGKRFEKISGFDYNGTALVNEQVLLDSILGYPTHDGSRILFLPDHTLLMTTGDVRNDTLGQYLPSVNGKTLRMTTTGAIPSDNPFPGSHIYTYGHRNAQGLFRASNGLVYSSEHGEFTDDEINILESGRNYGWPNVEGYCNTAPEIAFCTANNVREPIWAWSPTIAPAGICVYENSAIPEWNGKILCTVLKGKNLLALEMNGAQDSIVNEISYFNNWWGRLRDVCVAPNGDVYLATNGPSWGLSSAFSHRIVKISPVAPPPVTTEIGELAAPSPLRTYVDVSTGRMNFRTKTVSEAGTYSVFNSLGNLVSQGSFTEGHGEIPNAEWSSGLYIIQIDGTARYRPGKILLQ